MAQALDYNELGSVTSKARRRCARLKLKVMELSRQLSQLQKMIFGKPGHFIEADRKRI
jgi:hypothetical protein